MAEKPRDNQKKSVTAGPLTDAEGAQVGEKDTRDAAAEATSSRPSGTRLRIVANGWPMNVIGADERDRVDQEYAARDGSIGNSSTDAGEASTTRWKKATDRRLARADRRTARDDRAASAVDRRSAVEREVLNSLESENRAWDLLQALPDPVVVADAYGVIELINLQADALFGYQPAELIGQPVERLVPTGLHHAAYVAFEESRPTSAGPGAVAVRKDGTTVPVEINLSAIALSTGRAVLATIRCHQPHDRRRRTTDQR